MNCPKCSKRVKLKEESRVDDTKSKSGSDSYEISSIKVRYGGTCKCGADLIVVVMSEFTNGKWDGILEI